MNEIRDCLRAEGYSQNVVVGKYLSAQLGRLMLEANPASYGFSTRGQPDNWSSRG